jgi:DNA topoisomerase I
MTWYQRVQRKDGSFAYPGMPEGDEARVAALRIPPAYTDVFVNARPNAKIQAYGRDKKGRKQIIYHPSFVKKRAQQKYARMEELNKRMPALEARLARDVEKGHECAIVLSLIINCGFRIGSEKYLRLYGSYGLTTIEVHHVKPQRHGVLITFVGKKGVINTSVSTDRAVNRFIKKRIRRANPKDRVFNCSARDVNAYLHAVDGEITSKDLRTWRANVLFVEAMRDPAVAGAKHPEREALKRVAAELHNTPAVCRKSYVDPDLMRAVI